jgi:hypothetical protein
VKNYLKLSVRRSKEHRSVIEYDMEATMEKIEEEQFSPPEQRVLESKALQHLRDVTPPKTYRQMTDKQKDKYARGKANAAREYAEALIGSGTSPVEAWNRSVRLEIYGSESD